MKTMRIVLVAMIAIFMNLSTQAQNNKQKNESSVKTASFKVNGNCDLCKARIEKAAKIEGVSKAEWNKDTKILTVRYEAQKTSLDNIHKKIAEAGHDTDILKADDKAYNSLPACCHYERSKI
jgi:periplasmic mercuric ion binding protein